jgi:hypothetical protein
MPLSECAMQLLLQTGMRQDPEKTCSEEQLRRRLQELGLQACESAIAFERDFGGMIWDWNLWGTYAALLGRTSEDLWRIAFYRKQEIYHGEPLLPVGVFDWSDPSKAIVAHWISREGWILFDTQDYLYPVAESATCFIEREALRRGLAYKGPRAVLGWREIPTGTAEDFAALGGDSGEPDDDVEFEPRYLSDPQRLLDQQLAEALGLPLYCPASDTCMHVWYDGSNLLFPYERWLTASRVLRANTTEDLVRMVLVAVSMCPTAGVTWEGPLGEAPRPGEEIAAKIASIEGGKWRGHLLVVGQPGHYRMHERLFDKPLYVARLWEARREEWEGIQKRRLTR